MGDTALSLPAELINRPPVAAPHPVVALSVGRVAGRALSLLLPLLAYAALQAPGLAWQYECADCERRINELRLERRWLIAQRSFLLDPARLRSEALRLGLEPASAENSPLLLDTKRQVTTK